MPVATVRGVDINYEVLGERGPWVALQPGGRRALAGVKSLGEKLAEAGCRVLVYDRRNCGASSVAFEGGNSENEIWAEDLRALLSELDALPAYLTEDHPDLDVALEDWNAKEGRLAAIFIDFLRRAERRG